MGKIYKQNCKICKKYYEGVGLMYCSFSCYAVDKDIHKKHSQKMTGKIPWNKGIPHTKETKDKISNKHKKTGHLPPSQIGYTHKKETKEKIAKSLIGNTFAKGIKWTMEQRFKITKIPEQAKWGGKWRNTPEYKAWRVAVFKRDDYTCQMCGEKGKQLQADHIKKYADFPELRLELSNGRTLCVPCHKLTPNFQNKKPKEQYLTN